MSKQENGKLKAEQKGQINLEGLPVDDARQDEVKGGLAGYWQYHVASTGETFTAQS